MALYSTSSLTQLWNDAATTYRSNIAEKYTSVTIDYGTGNDYTSWLQMDTPGSLYTVPGNRNLDSTATSGAYKFISNCWTDMSTITYTPVALEYTTSAIELSAGVLRDGTTYGNALNIEYAHYGSFIYQPDPVEAKRERLRNNLVIAVKSRANPFGNVSGPELVALETLREMISESDFRKYLKYGFVLVEGASGDTYQIFRDRSHTKVWRGGILLEEICVRIKDSNVPKTDNVIAFMTIVRTDEDAFKALGNRYKMYREAA